MSMIVQIYFFKIEGLKLDLTTAHHEEVVDVVDQKAIDRCWSAVANKFAIPVGEMKVYEGYLTNSEVLPTSDDLQRIWLTCLENEEGNVDPEECHLCLRFFVAHKPSPKSNTPIPPSAVETKTVAAAAAAAASASGAAAVETKSGAALTGERKNSSDDSSRFGGMGSLIAAEGLRRAQECVGLLTAINAQVVSSPGCLDQSCSRNLNMIDVMGRGMTEMWKTWYLFTVATPPKVSECLTTASRHSNPFNPSSYLQPFISSFPGLNHSVFLSQNSALVCQMVALFAMSMARTTPPHPPPHPTPPLHPQATPLSWNPATFRAVETYLRQNPIDGGDDSEEETKVPKITSTSGVIGTTSGAIGNYRNSSYAAAAAADLYFDHARGASEEKKHKQGNAPVSRPVPPTPTPGPPPPTPRAPSPGPIHAGPRALRRLSASPCPRNCPCLPAYPCPGSRVCRPCWIRHLVDGGCWIRHLVDGAIRHFGAPAKVN